MTENRIKQALAQLFERHRIVFWYDEKQELRDAFDNLVMDDVEKVEIDNNEFTVKYRILREEPRQSFLVYREGKEPEYLDNWLLDIQLDNTVFRTDQSAIWLSELDLPQEYSELVTKHEGFFEAGRAPKQAEIRKQKLKALLESDDLKSQIRLKMLAVCAGGSQKADVRIDVICERLLKELVQTNQPRFDLIKHCTLEGFLWEQITRHYGYGVENPSIKDFSIELFKSCYALSIANPKAQDTASLNNDALVLFKRWKDSRIHKAVFERLSNQYELLLDIEGDLNYRDLKDVIDLDYYSLIDKKVLFDLVKAVEQRTLPEREITLYCRQRRQSHWYEHFEHLYCAIDVASQFLTRLDTVQLNMTSSSGAVHGYVRHWYKLDQLYRKFIYALKASGEMTLFSSLVETIENLYTNRYLSPLATQWQAQVDAMDQWSVPDVVPQRRFYRRWVKPYTDRGNKICVIISDAFRYEAGEEMVSRIRQEDKYQANLDHMLSSLPSYTQLGMVSLLPGVEGQLSISDTSGSVDVAGQSSQGTDNRDKLLKRALGKSACAVQAKSVMDMTQTEGRELFKTHDVIYVYHNRIDHAGDKMQSEGEAFDAAEKTFDELNAFGEKASGL